MKGVRIRWRGVTRVAAAAFVGLLVLHLLPGLLRAPEPPPLGADVGLPKAEPIPKPVRKVTKVPPKTKVLPDKPASKAVIGTHTHRRPHRRPQRKKPPPPPAVETSSEPVPEYTAPAPPEPLPEPLAEAPPAPPSTPGDGSQEFAPH
jgi:hypothetical protein